VDSTDSEELREELASLEARETQVSAERRRLHHQIDYGFANAEAVAREREVSDERRRLHRRIDALRELLGDTASAAPDASANPFSQWSGISPELIPSDAGIEDES
jgi:hypothetical protein